MEADRAPIDRALVQRVRAPLTALRAVADRDQPAALGLRLRVRKGAGRQRDDAAVSASASSRAGVLQGDKEADRRGNRHDRRAENGQGPVLEELNHPEL